MGGAEDARPVLEHGLGLERHVRILSRLKNEKEQKRVAKRVYDRRLSVRETENLVRERLERRVSGKKTLEENLVERTIGGAADITLDSN